jgi:hypothetical protein
MAMTANLPTMLNMMLVFAHLLAASMALGAIVATDLRLLSKLAQDRVRIAPPNPFVARLVMVALLALYVTGGAIVWQGALERADYLANPKLQAKVLLVVLLTLNAFVLHRLTFPRLARGRRVARWHAADWIVIAVPVAVSNFLWMFVAFLGIARPWNYSMPLRDILGSAAVLYALVQIGVFAILAMAGRTIDPERRRLSDVVRRSLVSLGNLGRSAAPAVADGRRRSRAPLPRSAPAESAVEASARPALRLVAGRASAEAARRHRP